MYSRSLLVLLEVFGVFAEIFLKTIYVLISLLLVVCDVLLEVCRFIIEVNLGLSTLLKGPLHAVFDPARHLRLHFLYSHVKS